MTLHDQPIRHLIRWGNFPAEPDETVIEFEQRTGQALHIYPAEPCSHCGSWMYGLICDGERNGEAWCMRCGSDAPLD